jgi:hypothetical protein
VNSVNVNRDVNVNANVDRHGGWDNDYHPLQRRQRSRQLSAWLLRLSGRSCIRCH